MNLFAPLPSALRAPASLLVLLLVATAGGQTHADLILHGGTVWTVNDAQPTARAVAVKGERILAVGSDAEILKLRGPATRVIDLEGRLALPGFCDNHIHFASAARFHEFNIMATSTQKDFEDRLRKTVASLPKGEWITGGFWGAYDQWAQGSAGGDKRKPFKPDMRRIEMLTSEHPVFIRKFDDSQFAVNTAALRVMRLDPVNPSARGVEFEKDAAGKITGILEGGGVRRLLMTRTPRKVSHARRIKQTLNALEMLRRFGVTSVCDMSDDEQLAIYHELRAQGKLTVRVHYRYMLDRADELAKRGIKVGAGDEWIRLGSLKGHIDGIMGTSSARFFEPYTSDKSNRGRWRRLMVDQEGRFVEGKFLKYMLDADKAGLQITVHAIGDEANHLLLDYLEALNRKNGKRDRRFRLVHAQVIHADDFKRLGRLGVVVEVQPFHLSDDMRWMEERIGRERCKGAYAFKRIKDSGAILCFGTDWPGTSAAEYPIDPMRGLYAAVTRQTVAGIPESGWFSDECLTIQDAIKAYTWNTAFANFEEDIKGSLEPGKLADIVVLSKNILAVPPAEYLTTRVVRTLVGGRLVYEAH